MVGLSLPLQPRRLVFADQARRRQEDHMAKNCHRGQAAAVLDALARVANSEAHVVAHSLLRRLFVWYLFGVVQHLQSYGIHRPQRRAIQFQAQHRRTELPLLHLSR